MSGYARWQRGQLADALLAAGPQAPTLCEGWTTRDLAAHLVVRERRPDASSGIVLRPLAGWGEHVRRQYRDTHSYVDLVAMVRSVPWWSLLNLAPLDEATNLLEFFVHHEDVRRGQVGWSPRELEPGLVEALWRRLPGLARLTLRRFGAPVAVQAPGFGWFTAGAADGDAAADGGGAAATDGGRHRIEVRGEPGELILFFFGRQRASLVDVHAPTTLAELAAKLRATTTLQ